MMSLRRIATIASFFAMLGCVREGHVQSRTLVTSNPSPVIGPASAPSNMPVLDPRTQQVFEIPAPRLVLSAVRAVTLMLSDGSLRALTEHDIISLGGERYGVRVPRELSGTLRIDLHDGTSITAHAVLRGNERTYCAWSATLEETLRGTLLSLGYGIAMTHGATVFDTEPQDGVALHIDVVNLVGVTYVQVTTVPAFNASNATVTRFFEAFERNLVLDGHCI